MDRGVTMRRVVAEVAFWFVIGYLTWPLVRRVLNSARATVPDGTVDAAATGVWDVIADANRITREAADGVG